MYSLSILCQRVLSGSHLSNGMATGHPPVRSRISWIGLMPLFSIASVERIWNKNFGQTFWKEQHPSTFVIIRTESIVYPPRIFSIFFFFFRIFTARELTFNWNLEWHKLSFKMFINPWKRIGIDIPRIISNN